jgi:cytochrome c peroxidase
MLSVRAFTLLAVLSIGFVSCTPKPEDAYSLYIPEGFTKPDIREDNPITEAKVNLGKRLFFDPILSRDTTISCGSCHHPNRAFSDQNAVSPGVDGKLGNRNAPTLSNLAWYPYFFAEGGNPNLESQILGPLEDPNEMDFSIVKAIDRLNAQESYVKQFQEVFGANPSAYTISRAIASYERSLVSGNSPFDKYYFQGDKKALNEQQKLGLELFMSSKLNCSSCHSGFLLTDFSFQNIGLYDEYDDPGRERLTLKKEDNGKFKVPTLRNIEVTGPYMHDGSIQTLDEVIEHYMGGGFDHPNKDSRIQPFLITQDEKLALIAFLKSLTDSEFLEANS